MKSERQEKVEEMLTGHVAAFIRKEANTNPLITITRCDIARDFKNATIYFTTIPEDKQDAAGIYLHRLGGDLRRYIKKHVHLRQIPFFSFSVDYGERHRQHIDTVAQSINTPLED